MFHMLHPWKGRRNHEGFVSRMIAETTNVLVWYGECLAPVGGQNHYHGDLVGDVTIVTSRMSFPSPGGIRCCTWAWEPRGDRVQALA